MTLVLKVLCSECGAKIGEAHRDDEFGGYAWRPVWETSPGVATPSGMDSMTTPRFWCVRHGYADRRAIEAAALAASTDRVATHRATMRR